MAVAGCKEGNGRSKERDEGAGHCRGAEDVQVEDCVGERLVFGVNWVGEK